MDRLRRIVLPALFGLAAPFLWVSALGWLALYAYSDLYLWIWNSFGLKGAVVFHAFSVLETIFFAGLFGAVLRLLSGPAWRTPVIAFCAAFVIILLAEPIWSGEMYFSTRIGVTVVALLVGTALVHAVLVYVRLK